VTTNGNGHHASGDDIVTEAATIGRRVFADVLDGLGRHTAADTVALIDRIWNTPPEALRAAVLYLAIVELCEAQP
jgi:hypothetical protein